MADVIDLTGDGGVIKQIVRRAQVGVGGPSDDLPLVDVHYVGILAETGKAFYSTFEDNHTFTFELGKGTVIKAWDIALRTMKVGELARITCKPEYAYGIYGFPPDIPPRATLIFEVELVACTTWKGFGLLAAEERARLEDLKKKKKGAAKEERKKKRQQEKEAATARAHAMLEAKRAQGKGKGKAK